MLIFSSIALILDSSRVALHELVLNNMFVLDPGFTFHLKQADLAPCL